MNSNDDLNTPENMENMMKMVQIMQMMNSEQSEESTEETYKAQEEITVKYFDDKLQTPEIRMIKSIIPFLGVGQQKNLAIFVKMMEMKTVMEYYQNTPVSAASEMYINKNNPEEETLWKKHMLMAIRPHLGKDQRNILDMLIKYIDMRKVIEST